MSKSKNTEKITYALYKASTGVLAVACFCGILFLFMLFMNEIINYF